MTTIFASVPLLPDFYVGLLFYQSGGLDWKTVPATYAAKIYYCSTINHARILAQL